MYKVLIVDDEPFILEGLRHVIRWEEHGLEIAGFAQNGLEALNILERTSIHILITDIYMSRMDGLELIRETKKMLPNVKIIILSGYEEFALVKEAAKLGIENYLLKPVEEEELSQTLLNCIEKIESAIHADIRDRELYHNIRDNILNRWVTGSIGAEELRNRAAFLNIDLSFQYYQVCIVQMLEHVEYAGAAQGERLRARGLLSYAVMNVCKETLEDGDCHIFNHANGDTIMLFYWNGGTQERAGVGSDVLQQCVDNVNLYLKIDLFLSVGAVGETFAAVPAGYRSAEKLRNYRLIMPANSIVDDAELRGFGDKPTIPFDYKALEQRMNNGDKRGVFAWIDGMQRALERTEGLTPEYVQSVAVETLFHLFGTLDIPVESGGDRSSEAAGRRELFRMRSPAEFALWLKSLAAARLDRTEEHPRHLHPTLGAVLDYVNGYYTEEMSLKTLANKFDINAAYLGQLFRQATGEIFSVYLNRKRIEAAKHLLIATTMKTSEIADATGFTSVHYFTNVFKKVTGFYPAEYKKMQENQH